MEALGCPARNLAFTDLFAARNCSGLSAELEGGRQDFCLAPARSLTGTKD